MVSWWEAVVVVVALLICVYELATRSSIIATAIALAGLPATLYFALNGLRTIAAARGGEIGLAHFEYDDTDFRFVTSKGSREYNWVELRSIGDPKSPLGVKTWYRPFSIHFRSDEYMMKRPPRGWTFDDLHADIERRWRLATHKEE